MKSDLTNGTIQIVLIGQIGLLECPNNLKFDLEIIYIVKLFQVLIHLVNQYLKVKYSSVMIVLNSFILIKIVIDIYIIIHDENNMIIKV